MNVASLELCQELYELSGWDNVPCWYQEDVIEGGIIVSSEASPDDIWNNLCPAYELGYLLRKLEIRQPCLDYLGGEDTNPFIDHYFQWRAYFPFTGKLRWADTPEDVVCMLAIELFKNGDLTKETP